MNYLLFGAERLCAVVWPAVAGPALTLSSQVSNLFCLFRRIPSQVRYAGIKPDVKFWPRVLADIWSMLVRIRVDLLKTPRAHPGVACIQVPRCAVPPNSASESQCLALCAGTGAALRFRLDRHDSG
jgi:hypothetical protein